MYWPFNLHQLCDFLSDVVHCSVSFISLKPSLSWHLSDNKLLIQTAFLTFWLKQDTFHVHCWFTEGLFLPNSLKSHSLFYLIYHFIIILLLTSKGLIYESVFVVVHPPQVAIPVVSVRLVKKHKTAGLVPNGLAITTDTGQKVNTSITVTAN